MASIFGKIWSGFKKAGETFVEVGALSYEIQALEAHVLSLKNVLPMVEVTELLQRIERIKQAGKAVVR